MRFSKAPCLCALFPLSALTRSLKLLLLWGSYEHGRLVRRIARLLRLTSLASSRSAAQNHSTVRHGSEVLDSLRATPPVPGGRQERLVHGYVQAPPRADTPVQSTSQSARSPFRSTGVG